MFSFTIPDHIAGVRYHLLTTLNSWVTFLFSFIVGVLYHLFRSANDGVLYQFVVHTIISRISENKSYLFHTSCICWVISPNLWGAGGYADPLKAKWIYTIININFNLDVNFHWGTSILYLAHTNYLKLKITT